MEGIFTRIDGCKVVSGTCQTCMIVKVWEWFSNGVWWWGIIFLFKPFLKGGSVLKTGILGNCVFATFSKNIKHLTFAGCQSEIPFNSSQLLSNPFESEVLLPICYQIFDDVLGRSQGVFYKKRVFYLEGVWLWRISGGYSQGVMGLTLAIWGSI